MKLFRGAEGRGIHMRKLDISQAFDSLGHHAIWRFLLETDSCAEASILWDLCRNTSVDMQLGTDTWSQRLGRGILQGTSFSADRVKVYGRRTRQVRPPLAFKGRTILGTVRDITQPFIFDARKRLHAGFILPGSDPADRITLVAAASLHCCTLSDLVRSSLLRLGFPMLRPTPPPPAYVGRSRHASAS